MLRVSRFHFVITSTAGEGGGGGWIGRICITRATTSMAPFVRDSNNDIEVYAANLRFNKLYKCRPGSALQGHV